MVFTRRRKIILIMVGIVTALVVLAGALSEYGAISPDAIKAHQDYIQSFISEDESSWTKLESEDLQENKQAVLENDRYKLELDLKTTHFTITDKNAGTSYESYPMNKPALLSEEDIARADSNIAISYYDSNSKVHYMGSGKDAISKGQYRVYQKGSRLRVVYVLGSAANDLLTPAVLTQETMENTIFPSLKVSDREKLKLYYKLYSDKKKPADYAEKMKLYPTLKDKNVYILTNDVTEQILGDIDVLMKKSELTLEQAAAEMKSLGVENVNDSLPAGFEIPLELSLDSDGFTAKILSDRIRENNETDKLVQVYLLEYFGAKNATADGYMLVPDGSGSLIEINQAAAQNYSQHLYNDDLLLKTDSEQQLSRNVPLPYFGMVSDSGSFFATVDGGAGMGTIFARTMGAANPLNMIGTIFNLRAMDKTDIGKDRNIPMLNVYNGHILYEHPTVKFTLMPQSEQGLSDMAEIYRNKLSKEGAVSSLPKTVQDVPLYLDFLCLSTKQVNVVGFSVSQKVVMSTLTEIKDIVEKLQSEGIVNIVVRLKGWNEQGLKHNAFNQCQLSRKVGTVEQLAELHELLTAKGGRLYLDTDFSFAQTNSTFDGLALARDTVRNLESSVYSLKEFDRVTLEKRREIRQGYVISPYSYRTFVDKFLLKYQTKNYNGIGLSWSSGGMYLFADYNKKTDLDMAYSTSVSADVFKRLSEASKQSVPTDYGYDYTLPFTEDIINSPITSSYFTAETASVPFMQMVLSGSKNMSGPALNFTGTRSRLTEMAASATAPYYLLMTADNDILRQLEIQESYYSLDYRMHFLDMVAAYKAYNNEVSEVYGTKIVNFTWLNEMVSCTTFESGKKIWVNRSGQEQTLGEVVLQPYEYRLTE